MSASASTWRVLSGDELRSEPEAKLGGALAVMVCAAAGIILVDFGRIGPALVFIVAMGGSKALLEMLAMPFALPLGGPAFEFIQRSVLLSQTVLFIWALVFVVMTLARSPRTPMVATFGLAIYLAVSITVSILARTLMQSWNIFTLLDAVPGSLLNIATFMVRAG
jgi:hypothetical protein